MDTSWKPTAPLDALQQRADFLAAIRQFFAERGVLEVETPILSHHGTTDPHIESFRTDDGLWLHTSPEFAMKRLLAAGIGPIYQLGKVFRHGEQGRRHNPEFTLLEWYRPGFSDGRLMDEVEALVRTLLSGHLELGEGLRLSYTEAFQQTLGLDPLAAPVTALAQVAAEHGIAIDMAADEALRDTWLELLMGMVVEPGLPAGHPVFITHYPARQASLARLDARDPRYARRFELFLGGLELANGFDELADAGEQARRFEQERQARRDAGQPDVAADTHLLAALEHGLPACAGVAVGVDRLLMLALGAEDIRQVIAFPFERA
jgi:lysyl-tRNA synthetase class 2